MFDELLHVGPIALLCTLPVALLGALLLHHMRRYSITAAVTVLVLVPVVATLAGVLGVNGWMLSPVLSTEIAVAAIPLGEVVSEALAAEAVTAARRGVRLQAWLRVDDGCGGIPEDDLDRVFDVGYRGTTARTPTQVGEPGAGLGLAIARGLVEAHSGHIQARNHGPGCRFEIQLPLAATPANPE